MNHHQNALISLNRRELMRWGAGTIVSLSGLGHAQDRLANSSGPKVVVGAHVWVYAAKQPDYNMTPILPRIFADLTYAGLDGVELMHNVLREPDTVNRIGELSQQHGLPVIGTSFSGHMWDKTQHQAVYEDADKVIEHLAQLGGTTFGVSVGRAPKKKTESQLDDQAELLGKVMVLGQKHGVTVNLHNHTYEVVDDLHDLKGTLKRIPNAPLGPDLNWLVRGGVDPVWFIRTYGSQLVFLHLRDQASNGRWSEALGEGDMDYRAIATALRDVQFKGHAVIELAHEGDFEITRPLRESWKKSRDYLRTVLGY
jgi:sugar phosphate isomerase/epimerase